MQIVFFKRPKPRQFDYKPAFYSEDKERQEERKKVNMLTDEGRKSLLKREIAMRWRKIDHANRTKARGANLLVYAFIAAVIVYFIFFV